MLSEAEKIELAELEELERLEKAHGLQSVQPGVIQEQSPLISTGDRLKVKNFSNSDESAIKYLQDKNPGAEVKMMNGQLVIRGQGDKDFKVLDPDTGTFSSDFLSDVGDLGWDAVDSVGTTLGTAGGALVGALGLNPVTIGAGAVAGGASSAAALEASRQKIGQQLGLPQEVSGTDVALSGAFGAASPLLFGQGNKAKNVVKMSGGADMIRKALGKEAKSLTQEGAEELVKRTDMKGAIPWALSKTPDMMGFMSGKGGDSVRRLAKDIKYVDEVEKAGSLASEAELAATKLAGGFDSKMDEVGGQLADAIDSSGQRVNIGEAKNAFQHTINQLEIHRTEANTPILNAQIAKIRNAYDKLFGVPVPIDDAKPGPTIDMMTGKAYPKAPTTKQVADEVSGRTARKLQQDTKSFANFSPQIGVSAEESAADTLLRGAAGKSYGAMNESLDAATGGVSTELKGRYKEIADLERALEGNFRNPKSTLNTARAFDKDSQTIARASLDKARKLGIDGAEDFDQFVSAAQWSNLNGISNPLQMRGIPGAALGGVGGFWLGSNIGAGPGGGTVGGGLGALGGAALLGPKAVKFAVRNAMRPNVQKAANVVTQQIPKYLPPKHLMSRGLYDYMADDKN